MKRLLLGLLAGCALETPDEETVAPEETSSEVRIIYQGRLDGEIEPCG